MRPGVAMVKAGNPRESDDPTGVRRFDSPRNRRVSVERHMRAVLVEASSQHDASLAAGPGEVTAESALSFR